MHISSPSPDGLTETEAPVNPQYKAITEDFTSLQTQNNMKEDASYQMMRRGTSIQSRLEGTKAHVDPVEEAIQIAQNSEPLDKSSEEEVTHARSAAPSLHLYDMRTSHRLRSESKATSAAPHSSCYTERTEGK